MKLSVSKGNENPSRKEFTDIGMLLAQLTPILHSPEVLGLNLPLILGLSAARLLDFGLET